MRYAVQYFVLIICLLASGLLGCGPSAAVDSGPVATNPPSGLRDFASPTAAAAPTSEAGYAENSGLYLNVTYDAKPQYVNVNGADGPNLDAATATFKPTTSGAILTVDGTEFVLTTSSGNGDFNYAYAAGDVSVKVEVYTVGTEVFLTYASVLDGTTLTDGFAPIGANTDPANVPTSGFAGYSGVFAGYANYTDGTFDALSGTMAFSVNFDESTISGGGTLSPTGTSDVYGTVNLDTTDIIGNTFAAQPTVIFTNPDQTAQGTFMSGDFYGPAATEIAGVIAIEASNPDGAVTVQGAFHAD
ncbi:MAG: transferrin-binding protein-like solute binding protein [Planktomarina sp.]